MTVTTNTATIMLTIATTPATARTHAAPAPDSIGCINQPQMAADFHWNRVVTRGVEICPMSTDDHLAMLTEPGVRALAAHLNRVLGGATRTRAAAL